MCWRKTLDMGDSLSNRWFLVKMILKEELDFVMDLIIFLGHCFSLEAVLSSCPCTAVHSSLTAAGAMALLRGHLRWGSSRQLELLLFPELGCGCSRLHPASSGTERWGFHFYSLTSSPSTAFLQCTNKLLLLCTWCCSNIPLFCAVTLPLVWLSRWVLMHNSRCSARIVENNPTNRSSFYVLGATT